MSKLLWECVHSRVYIIIASNVGNRRGAICDREQLSYWATAQSSHHELDHATSIPWLMFLPIQAICSSLLSLQQNRGRLSCCLAFKQTVCKHLSSKTNTNTSTTSNRWQSTKDLNRSSAIGHSCPSASCMHCSPETGSRKSSSEREESWFWRFCGQRQALMMKG